MRGQFSCAGIKRPKPRAGKGIFEVNHGLQQKRGPAASSGAGALELYSEMISQLAQAELGASLAKGVMNPTSQPRRRAARLITLVLAVVTVGVVACSAPSS